MKGFFKIMTDYSLLPCNEETEAYIGRREVGQVISADIKQCRNYPNLQRFMKFIDDTYDMQKHFKEPEAYRYWLTMKAGFFDTIVAPNGTVIFKPKSISFENMEEEEFRKVFSRVIDVFLKEHELTENEINQVISYI